ncbi:hypothetical protein AX774_g2613 [Zancudomyces culisetae]|uniref:Uncharacterized protein n=1 Tax=Zancudomyces culisetae TaxID=1213189 RepID=A0A1R1PSD1_ZANCU|nr:hypothetical protein AX774_g2613 [Zancudomyces culisetae]|eukprot:OMH83877.1 hypothetical protein AX774_g2613 [Zancudomyces culisetae]
MKYYIFGTMLLALNGANGQAPSDMDLPYEKELVNNNLLFRNRRGLKVEMFLGNNHKERFKSIKIRPNKCYRIPSIKSARFQNGKPGKGWMVFCNSDDCGGKCLTESRKTWRGPKNIEKYIGGAANSMIWLYSRK